VLVDRKERVTGITMEQDRKLQIKSFSDVMNDATQEPIHIIGGGILPHKALLLISGQQKARKSFLVNNLALAIAAGNSFACFRIEKPQRVLLLAAEGGYFSNRTRLQKMASHISSMKPENLHLCFDARIKLEDDCDIDLLKSKISDYQPSVLIIDPFVKFHGEDENSTKEMSNILNKLRNLIEDCGISIILVHHQGKDESRSARGSSAILGEYDSHIKISKNGNANKLEFELRHAAPLDGLQIQFNPETFWFELSYQHPLVMLVSESPGELRKRVVEMAVEKKIYKSDNGAYKALDKFIVKGILRLDEDKIYTGNSPFSNSPRRIN
jgi:archaellum biogenesis ATPase FlaH